MASAWSHMIDYLIGLQRSAKLYSSAPEIYVLVDAYVDKMEGAPDYFSVEGCSPGLWWRLAMAPILDYDVVIAYAVIYTDDGPSAWAYIVDVKDAERLKRLAVEAAREDTCD